MIKTAFAQQAEQLERTAFTLVELLTVVTLITLLTAIVLPVCARAKHAALSAQCRSNLRQLLFALRMYVDDNNGYPLAAGYGGSAWASQLAESYLDDKSVTVHQSLRIHKQSALFCPARPKKPGPKDTLRPVSYGYNDIGYARLGLGGELDSSIADKPVVSPVRDFALKVPSQMLAMGDGVTRVSGGELVEGQELQRWVSESAVGEMGLDLSAQTRGVYAQHGGSVQIALCDGHIESPPICRLFFSVEDDWLSLWNRDHLPHPEYLTR